MNHRPETTISQRAGARTIARIKRNAEARSPEARLQHAYLAGAFGVALERAFDQLAAFDAPDAALYRADWHGHDVKVEVEEDDDTDGFTVVGVYLNGAEISEAIATEDLWKIESAVRYQREMEAERAEEDLHIEAAL